MLENPFAAPRADVEIGAVPVARFEVGRSIADAWRAVVGDLAVVIMASLIFLSLALASIASVLGSFLFFPVLAYGAVRTLLNLCDGIAGYTDLGDGFPRYWSALGAALVMMLLQALLLVPWIVFAIAGVTVDSPPLAAVAHVMGAAATAALAPRFAFAPFYVVDRDLGPSAAMRASWNVTADQKLATLALVACSLIIAIVGVGCGVTAVLSVPMAAVMFASAFRQMNPKLSPPRQHVRASSS